MSEDESDRARAALRIPRYGSGPYRRELSDPAPIPFPPPGQFARGYASGGNGLPGRDRQPLYGLAVEEHDHALESLWQAVQELEQRLGPALTPPGPTGTQGAQGGGQQPVAALPPIVERVNTQTRKVRMIESRLRDIADRVEV